jgi:hypothetical protein
VAPVAAWFLVLLSLTVAIIFGRQQLRSLRGTTGADQSPEDATYHRRQAWRRLAGCALLVSVAVMISVWFLTGQSERMDRIGDEILARHAAGEAQLTPEQEQAKQFFAYYWIAVLLQLLVLIILVAFELGAIRRYAARHSRQIRDDRRTMLERELAALRRERRGTPGDPSAN